MRTTEMNHEAGVELAPAIPQPGFSTVRVRLWRSAPLLVIAALLASDLGPAYSQSAEASSSARGVAAVDAEKQDSGAKVAEELADAAHAGNSISHGGIDRGAVVRFDQDVELKAGDTADVVVVIGGSAKIHGKVRNAIVAIGGDIEVDGEAEDAVVSVLGRIHVAKGATLHQQAVAVMGDLTVDKGATVHGDTVAVGGALDVADGATVTGQTQEVGLRLDWLRKWFVQCVFKLRPLAPQVGWVWAVAGVYFLFYLLIAAAFPRPVQACVDQLNQRAAGTFLFGLLTKVLVPFVFILLAVTGVGLLVLPFLGLALFLGAAVGKVALMEWLGFRIGQQAGAGALQRPLVALVVGAAIVTLFYMVWVVGLLAYILFSIWGLGVGVTTVISGLRRRTPDRGTGSSPGIGGPGPAPFGSAPAGFGSAPASGFAGTVAAEPSQSASSGGPGLADPANLGVGAPPPLAPTSPPLQRTVVPEALSYPRAGFWERMAAAFLDLVIVAILSVFVHGMSWTFVMALAYFTAMWTWRSTTVGSIVLGLKLARVDGQVISFTVAFVRALAAAFSVAVLFLGFLWIAWDPEKQGWHDRIAGTVVLRLPRGLPLV